MSWHFLNEASVILSQDNKILALTHGEPGSTDFPEELMTKIHRMSPGYINRVAHVHPEGMTELSHRDKQTMYTWAFSIYPYPIVLSTITIQDFKLGNGTTFMESIYTGLLEPREFWERRGKGDRNFDIKLTEKHAFMIPEHNEGFLWQDWKQVLIEETHKWI